MYIVQHYNRDHAISSIDVSTNENLRLKMSLKMKKEDNRSFFDEIHVAEYEESEDAYVDKFHFVYGGKEGNNSYKIANGFSATNLLEKDTAEFRNKDVSYAVLDRLFYDESTSTNIYGGILTVLFRKGVAIEVKLFDLVIDELVPVAKVTSDGYVSKEKGYEDNVCVVQERCPGARVLPRVKPRQPEW